VRLFVAVDISDDTRAAMRDVRRAIERAVSVAAVPPRITWVSESVAHVTVRFIGEVDDEAAARVAASLLAPIDMAPFDIEWATVGAFPAGRAGLRAPRALWIAATAGASSLVELATAVNRRLVGHVGAGDARPYSPHLTIGRVKLPGRHVPWADALAAAQPNPTRSRIDRVTLYRSQLSSRGPTYTAVCEARLLGDPK
jgi:RNA 2',3'-cyclic 3'-phosphodiesterase